MKKEEFVKRYWADIQSACRETGLNPCFVAAQAALESGWGANAIGNNLFGITAGDKWTGLRKRVRTTEYFKDDKQGDRFPEVHSITALADGRYRYDVERDFRDYPSVRDGLIDHFKVLSMRRYKPAFEFVDDVRKFAEAVARAGYCTASPTIYANSIASIARDIKRLTK